MTKQKLEARISKLERANAELTVIVSEQAQKIEELEAQLMHERRSQTALVRRQADERRRILVINGTRGRA